MTPSTAPRRALARSRRIAAFSAAYLLRFLRANYEVAREVVTPGNGLAPAVVEVPLLSGSPFEIASFTSLVTLTPGTMALELSDDRSRLTVHGMHVADPEAFRADLRELEERMLRAWRPVTSRHDAHTHHPTRRRTP
ncbi:multicomponent Na+:H+ antiporter subunit E [Geodermatophilus obscurus]|uniref:Multicomponent Na+:H+ antiporter subunit E n=1 Tax=Geodermatophilus obscurus TaxID=1861 RepID=A0A1I5HHD9_9ACTN|nr:Na+/H+ antiporter subunit E [Geodermatophilus obscurus]SFO47261.1 multicomponent Na+:H+ antiporter subunit E [Geodermatophilus obscurus]